MGSRLSRSATGIACSSLGTGDTSPLVPLSLSNPHALPQYLPLVLFSPVLGVIIVALLLATRGRRWDPLARAALVFGGISVLCGFMGTLVTAYGLGFTDSAVVRVRVLDEGAIASLLAYAVVLVELSAPSLERRHASERQDSCHSSAHTRLLYSIHQ